MKTMRHPSILKYEWDQHTDTVLSMITESVTPLVATFTWTTAPEVCLGLYILAQGLDFMHTKVRVVAVCSGGKDLL